MIDIWIPTVDGHTLILPRYAQLSVDPKILLEKLKFGAAEPAASTDHWAGTALQRPGHRWLEEFCGEGIPLTDSKELTYFNRAQPRGSG
jgi:hypothetical protein